MDIEISETTLKRFGILVLVIAFIGGWFIFFGPGASSNPIKLPDIVKVKNDSSELPALLSVICADTDLAIKYEQDPASTHPQLVKLDPYVQKYELLTGMRFQSSICLQK